MAKTKAFSDILKDRMSKCKPTFQQPWRLIYFADEAASGNLLRRDPAKKAWCIYFNWVEMGTALISQDISWIYGGIIHLNKVKEVDGGFWDCLQAPHGLFLRSAVRLAKWHYNTHS